MLPQSPFAAPRTSFANPVSPPGSDPQSPPFYYVRFNQEWLPFVVGALKQLAYQSPWQTATLDDSLLAQFRAMNILQLFNLSTETPIGCTPVSFGGEDDEMTQLRVDCEGIAHFYDCNGVEYTLDLKNVNPSGQPGGGSPQPGPGGGQACYTAEMQGGDFWILPTVVNTGDIIEFSSETGAVSADGIAWKCPDGSVFFAGGCVGVKIYSGANILPSAPTGSLIFSVDGTYYPATDGSPFTVPGGVTNGQVIVQVNYPVATAIHGSFAFKVCATNNGSSGWEHIIHFDLVNGGFSPFTASGYGTTGAWVPGTGWQAATASNPGDPSNSQTSLLIERAIAVTTNITEIGLYYSTVDGKGTPPATRELVVGADTLAIPDSTGAAIYSDLTGHTNPSNFQIVLASYKAGVASTGSITATALIVRGNGNDPWPDLP